MFSSSQSLLRFCGSVVKNLPANARDSDLIPGSERSPGGGSGNPLSILAWRMPWTEEPGGLQPMGSQGAGHDDVSAFFVCFVIYHCCNLTRPWFCGWPRSHCGQGICALSMSKIPVRPEVLLKSVCQVEPLFPSLLSCVQNYLSAFLPPFC